MIDNLERVTASINRENEYFSIKELQTMTGQSVEKFGDVIIKELLDNSVDAAESAKVSPEMALNVKEEYGRIFISVKDNGKGMNESLISKILDFSSRSSDKSIYRSPTRGAQGNALKTILGIPYALGSKSPITIKSQNKQYEIKLTANPVGNIEKNIEVSEIDFNKGTEISLCIPEKELRFSPDKWPYAFSLFNPHMTLEYNFSVKNEEFEDEENESKQDNNENQKSLLFTKSYNFEGGEWKKFIPTDYTSPLWYDNETFQKLIYSYIYCGNGKSSLTLRDFIMEFRGLNSTGKAKNICNMFPDVFRLKDLTGKPEQMENLLSVMKEEAKPPKAKILGYVGEEHFKKCFDAWFNGLVEGKYKYKRVENDGEKPYIIEFFLGEVNAEKGGVYYAANFSPTFSDPLSDTYLKIENINTWGFSNFLNHCYCNPLTEINYSKKNIVAALHIVSPYFETLDKGKTRLVITKEMKTDIEKVLWSLCEPYYKAAKRKEKDAAKEYKREIEETKKINKPELFQNEIIFSVLPDAVKFATTDGKFPVSCRSLYYAARPLIQKYTDEAVKYNYFCKILTEYQLEKGKIPQLYYETKGYLYEPHTKKEIKLGTLEVSDYVFPELLYDKILYIEKRGLMKKINSAQIPERYDLAIVAGEGYSTEAIRHLFSNAQKDKNYKLFVLHDADHSGYDIARTLKEETDRMPGHSIDVIDIGLFVQDAIDMGIEHEEYTRKKALPEKLELNEIEREYFEGKGIDEHYDYKQKKYKYNSYICKRIELDAVSKTEMLNTYIEEKLKEHGADKKIIPPEDLLKYQVIKKYREDIDCILESKINRVFNTFRLKLLLSNKAEKEYIPNLEPILTQLGNNTPYHWKDLKDPGTYKQAEKDVREIDFKAEIEAFLEESLQNLKAA